MRYQVRAYLKRGHLICTIHSPPSKLFASAVQFIATSPQILLSAHVSTTSRTHTKHLRLPYRCKPAVHLDPMWVVCSVLNQDDPTVCPFNMLQIQSNSFIYTLPRIMYRRARQPKPHEHLQRTKRTGAQRTLASLFPQ